MRIFSRRCFLGRVCRWTFWGLGLAPTLSILMKGCKTLDTLSESGASIRIGGVTLDSRAIAKSARALSRSFEDITPEQEYYIGRTVAAMILQRYRAYKNMAANRYINTLGQTLAQASDLPETYGGYHFLIQDSDEINAFSAPGGLVFVTHGILRCCPHEDAVAAVLAHEIGHVQHRHGLQVIKKSRVTTALTTLAVEGTKTFGSEELAQLTRIFEDTIADITSALIVNGYSRSFEYQADLAAVTILQRIGYNPSGLVDMLRVMQKRLKPGGLDFAKTHPPPANRISEVQQAIGYSKVDVPPARQARFQRALGSI